MTNGVKNVISAAITPAGVYRKFNVGDPPPVTPAMAALTAPAVPYRNVKASVMRNDGIVATLPVGYGDGWARAYGGRTQALVRGRRVPLVGSVAMDAVMADVSDVPGVTTQDEFVLLGEQGGERIAAADLALVRTTISWEVLASMSARVARVYHASTGLTGLRTLAGEHLRPEERHV